MASHEAAIFMLSRVLSACRRRRPWPSRQLEIIRDDGSRDRRGIWPLEVGRIGDPASGAKGWVIEYRSIQCDEALANAVLDIVKIAGPQLIDGKPSLLVSRIHM